MPGCIRATAVRLRLAAVVRVLRAALAVGTELYVVLVGRRVQLDESDEAPAG